LIKITGNQTTMSQPLTSDWITLPGADGDMGAYLALPPGGQGPGLLLLQEIFGVNEHIRSVAHQYAQAGFVVLAPDVFWRQAPRVELGYEGAERQRGRDLAASLQAPQVAADLQRAVTALRARPEVGQAKVGAIGYCMGGRLAYLAAAMGGVDAAVAYYGGGIQGQLGLAAQVQCPMQFHYAEHDEHIPPEAVAAVQQAFAGRAVQVLNYPDAHHGFNCWARASYHAPSAALALGRSLTFLAENLF
jgi:carboxymethylenebutenolidase